jgi:hypothetical protein
VQIHNKEHDSKYIHKHNTFTSTNNMRQRLCVDNVSTIDHMPLIFSLMSANANHYFIVANAIFNNNYFPSIMICARARSVWIYLVCLKISSLKRLIKVGFGGKVVRDKIVQATRVKTLRLMQYWWKQDWTMLCCPHCSQLSTTLNNIVTPDSGSTMLFNIVDKCMWTTWAAKHCSTC